MYFLPRMDNYYSLSSHFKNRNFPVVSEKEMIGGKAYGLFKYIEDETLPFVVIKSNLYITWTNNRENAENILRNLVNKVSEQFASLNICNYIVRSSARFESSRDRGNYISSDGNITNDNLYETILRTWESNQDICNEYASNPFSLIIQQYIQPKLTGHLSNERRISRNTDTWFIEYYDSKGVFNESQKVRYNSNKKLQTRNFNCTNKTELKEILKWIPHYFNITKQIEVRCHIEWIWDGRKLILVQCDIDEVLEDGTEPGSEWKNNTKIISTSENLELLKKFSTNRCRKWSKTNCVQTFIELNLPFGEIYILDDTKVLEDLSNGIKPEGLYNDLKWLLEYPIVIRTDILSKSEYNRILLPRTDTIFKIEDTFDYLIKQVQYFIENDIDINNFCFLIHRFILSKSCALAFSKPNIPKTRIDSTWGIVDGLYYHPHDSYEISIIDKIVKKQIRCKNEYLDVNLDGTWFSKKSGSKYDWKESLNKNQQFEIAKYTTQIANFLGVPVTVMYFVDIDKCTGYKNILPWFYTTEEVTANSEKFSDSIFSNDYILIETYDDLKNLENQDIDSLGKHTIRLRPNAEIIRDKEVVEEIANFALKYKIPVELEGSILAHPYYILRKNGVRVKCSNYFDPKYDSKDFYKLVRDKIPINIESRGEKTTTIKIEPKQLLSFLKEKAIEEALEFYWESANDAVIEELADIYEIIRSSCNVFNIA